MKTTVRKLPSVLLRCKGKQRNECLDCVRHTSPPHEFQSYIRVWQGHGDCPDKISESEAELKFPRRSNGENS